MKKSLLVTFDYEIFLGQRSGRPLDALLNPTEQLRIVLNERGVKAIFFVDTTYLITLEKYALTHSECKDDFNAISSQLQQLLKDGHYIFPHIHPHWLDAVYNTNTREFNLSKTEKYRFHQLCEADRTLVFNESIRILRSIVDKVNPEYKIDGYRAGGWSIQPVTDFIPYFKNHGIKYDFSVMQRFYQFSNAQYFDYSNIPASPIYKFENDITKEDKNGNFIQISSSIINVKPYIRNFDRLHRKLLFKVLNDHTFKRGIGQQSEEIKGILPESSNGFSVNNLNVEPISLELLSIIKLPTYLKFIKNNDYIHFVSHPKMLSKHNILSLKNFLTSVYTNYEIESDFKKIVTNYV